MSLATTPRGIIDRYFGATHEEEHFRLNDSFIRSYAGRRPNFGFNGLGEFAFYRTYSRLKPDNRKETFTDVIRRVVEGCYEIQRRHCQKIHVPFGLDKAQASAQEMFQLMWDFKFLPPGRGLWMMGTDFMWERGSAALNNCGFCSTVDIADDPAECFGFLMDMSMLGVGIGFDTRGAGKLHIGRPAGTGFVYEIPDSREGWVKSVCLLIESYTSKRHLGPVTFVYDGIRKAGSDIRGFGGKASGPSILMDLHGHITALLERFVGRTLDSVGITDLMNLIGKCVVAGNVRRSSEIAFGDYRDADYCNMKNPQKSLLPCDLDVWYRITGILYQHKVMTAQPAHFSEAFCHTLASIIDNAVDDTRLRQVLGGTVGEYLASDLSGLRCQDLVIPAERLLPAIETWNALNSHRWASNNSIMAEVGMDYSDVARSIAVNGEPGLMWLNAMRDYGRMADGIQPGIDGRAMGSNPCVEQTLESYELCCLVESFPAHHDTAEEYMRTLKFAYLYGKTVTLLPTHNARTNAVMLRNRRIGVSQSGIAQAFAKFGRRDTLTDFCDRGYKEIRRWDRIYSSWLCIPNSIKVTSVKPSGTVSLVAGATPGIHYPEAIAYWRRVRINKDSMLVSIFAAAGYHVEMAINDPNTAIIKFAVVDERVRPVEKVGLWEQMANAADYQHYWADNQVSCTVKFQPHEADQLKNVLEVFEERLKGISFLPHTGHGFQQAPYEPCTVQEVLDYNSKLGDVDLDAYIEEAVGTTFCDGEACTI